jgi:hypothetical protein
MSTDLIVLVACMGIVMICFLHMFDVLRCRICDLEGMLKIYQTHDMQLSPMHIPNRYKHSAVVELLLKEAGYEWQNEKEQAGFKKTGTKT